MSNVELYQRDPRKYALNMVEDERVSAYAILTAMLVSMPHEDVRRALDTNELSPRFDNEDEGE